MQISISLYFRLRPLLTISYCPMYEWEYKYRETMRNPTCAEWKVHHTSQNRTMTHMFVLSSFSPLFLLGPSSSAPVASSPRRGYFHPLVEGMKKLGWTARTPETADARDAADLERSERFCGFGFLSAEEDAFFFEPGGIRWNFLGEFLVTFIV